EEHEAERIVNLQDPLEIRDVILVAACRLRNAANILCRAERREFESAHRIFAADEEALRLRNAQRVVLFEQLRARIRAVLVERINASDIAVEAHRQAS